MKIEEREMWKPVKGYEGYYEINKQGEVKSLHKKNYGYIMNQRFDRGGYYTVRLSKPDMRSCTVYVHRLLGYAFIANPENKPFINHKSGNKLNNEISNLEWVTASENMNHAYQNGLSNRPGECREIIDNFSGKIYKSLKEAAEYNFIEYKVFKSYMKESRNNRTSMRYRYDTKCSRSINSLTYDKDLFLPIIIDELCFKAMLLNPYHSLKHQLKIIDKGQVKIE